MHRKAGWILGSAALVVAGLVAGVVLTANWGWLPLSRAQEQPAPAHGFFRGGESPFVAVAEEVLPAVVSVDTKRTVRSGADPFREMFKDFFGERMFKEYFGNEGQSREFEMPGSASGFIFDPQGYILTNNHVVNGASEIAVTLNDGREFKAEIVGQDPSTDVAVIRIQGKDLPSVRLGDSDALKPGAWAIAIGSPLELRGTVTVGVISAVGRVDLNIQGGTPVYQNFIQTDASINFGNSGGPLVNIDGEVVGLNTAINPMANGIGFAIPINLAREVAEALMSGGKVVRGYLGVVPQEITRELAEAKDLGETKGVIIASVEKGTPADDAGLLAGDVILEFAGTKISDVPQFRRVVAGVTPGKAVDVVVIRDGKTRTLKTTLSERPDVVALQETQTGPEETKWLGIEAVDLNDPIARDLDVQAQEGVLVVRVERGSPAAGGGLAVGDVILRIGDRPVRNLADYRSIIRDVEGQQKALAFMVQRGAYTLFVAVKPEK
jgi:serine protease Do